MSLPEARPAVAYEALRLTRAHDCRPDERHRFDNAVICERDGKWLGRVGLGGMRRSRLVVSEPYASTTKRTPVPANTRSRHAVQRPSLHTVCENSARRVTRSNVRCRLYGNRSLLIPPCQNERCGIGRSRQRARNLHRVSVGRHRRVRKQLSISVFLAVIIILPDFNDRDAQVRTRRTAV